MANESERRRYHRFTVSAILIVPTIPDSPLEAEDICAGGFKARFSEQPELGILHETLLLLPGATFRNCLARAVWVQEIGTPPPVWTAGFVLLMEIRQREPLLRALEKLAARS